jgi:nucleoside-diphosphate-sugar epimerase
MEDRSWDTNVWVADSALARQALGWSPAYDFERGLVTTIDWLRADGMLRELYQQASQR